LDKISTLIGEKYKDLKQKVIKNSSKFINIGEDDEVANKTLKYSKSAENLKNIQSNKRPSDTMTVVKNNNLTVSHTKN
jgi:hypothetical protein